MNFTEYLDLVIAHIQTNRGLTQTITGVAKQTAYTASGAVAGGLALGPVGALGGSVAGAVVGFIRADSYPNVFELINELSDDQKKALVQAIVTVAGGLTIEHFYTWYSIGSNQKELLSLIAAAASTA